MTTFEDYLEQVHARSYTGTDDEMPNHFEYWVENLDTAEIIEYANQAITELTK